MSQQKYILNLLKDTRKLVYELANRPIDHNYKLKKAKENVTVDK